jgi:hypothetical protein
VTSVDLIVLMIADNGLRSALAARLTLQGENVVSLLPDDPELDQLSRTTSALVADHGVVPRGAAWRHVITLDERPRPGQVARVVALLADMRGVTPAE